MVSVSTAGCVTAQDYVQRVSHDAAKSAMEGAAEGLPALKTPLQSVLRQTLLDATRALARANGELLVNTLAAGLDVQLQHIRETARDVGRGLINEAAGSMNDNKEVVGRLMQVAMLHAMRGAREGVREGLPENLRVPLTAAIVVLGTLLAVAGTGLALYWRRYQQSAKSLTIIAESINQHGADDLKATIHARAHENYVGPWLSDFLKRRGL